MNTTTRIVLCAIAGIAFGFGPEETHLISLLFLPLAVSRSVYTSCACVFSYMSAANIPTFLVSIEYTNDLALSIVYFLVPVMLNVVLIGIPLGLIGIKSTALLVSGMLMLFLPPLSSYNPLSIAPIAGMFFPGAGTIGLAAFALLVIGFTKLPMKMMPVIAIGAIFIGSANASKPVSTAAIGIDTYRGNLSEVDYSARQMMFRYEEYELAENTDAKIVLFPEAAYREWNRDTAWILESSEKQIIGGARKYIDNKSYVNTLVDGKTGQVLYAQKTPIPVNVKDRHKAVPNSVANIKVENPISALICIEAVNTWTSFNEFRQAKKQVYFAANLGWSKHEWFGERIKATMNQWGKLYGVKVVSAVNYAG